MTKKYRVVYYSASYPDNKHFAYFDSLAKARKFEEIKDKLGNDSYIERQTGRKAIGSFNRRTGNYASKNEWINV